MPKKLDPKKMKSDINAIFNAVMPAAEDSFKRIPELKAMKKGEERELGNRRALVDRLTRELAEAERAVNEKEREIAETKTSIRDESALNKADARWLDNEKARLIQIDGGPYNFEKCNASGDPRTMIPWQEWKARKRAYDDRVSNVDYNKKKWIVKLGKEVVEFRKIVAAKTKALKAAKTQLSYTTKELEATVKELVLLEAIEKDAKKVRKGCADFCDTGKKLAEDMSKGNPKNYATYIKKMRKGLSDMQAGNHFKKLLKSATMMMQDLSAIAKA